MTDNNDSPNMNDWSYPKLIKCMTKSLLQELMVNGPMGMERRMGTYGAVIIHWSRSNGRSESFSIMDSPALRKLKANTKKPSKKPAKRSRK